MRPCPKCTFVLENNTAVCPECGNKVDEKSPRTTAVQTPSKEALEADRTFWRLNLISYGFVTFIITVGACGLLGWWGVPVGLGVSLLFCTFFFFLQFV
ncbi:MAG: hypothetical protein P8M30_00370 [Planctomycetaceae bacterium]|jgi:hypothetical protein|nr:hypothetical protein [Planctomycetaceae bacterium]MDG2387748.1 hypothetical protein [Planctomycetaceae bacterium]